MRVLIAGGGTGGLATALALRKVGIDPLVLEQAPAFAAIGAGLGLQVNAMRAITYIGGDAYWREASTKIAGGEQFGLEDGAQIASSSNAGLVQKYGEQYRCGHRADLMQSLLRPLPEDLVRVASRVVEIEETPHDVRVGLEGGDELRGDLLVGADGLRSTVRSILFEEPDARFTGTVVWRGLIPTRDVPERFHETLCSWYGPRRHVLVYPLRNRSQPEPVHSFSAFVPVDEVQRESWTASGDLADLRKSLEGACPTIHALLDCMNEALITGIYFRDPLDSWGTDRIVLLGDAAHPAPPSAGQGAGMALEDAVMLAACLERNGPGNETEALREYVYRRMPRTVRMLESSRVNLANSQQSDPVQVRARNGYVRGLRRLSPVSPPMGEWLLGHDPVAAALQSAEEFEQARAVSPNPMRRPDAQRAFEAWRSALSLEHRARGWLGEREGYRDFLGREGADNAPVFDEIDCDGVRVLRVPADGAPADGPVVLHLHGGGFVMGSAETALSWSARVAAALGGVTFAVDYRLAPEHPFPAALDDTLAAYRWLARTYPGTPVVLSGEDAGGALAVSCALAIRDAGEAPPALLHLVSPFLDLTADPDFLNPDGSKDPWLDRIVVTQYAASYIQDTDPALPLVSPMRAELSQLPPLLIHAAADELLLPGIDRFATRADAAGVRVRLCRIEDSVHSFVLFSYLEEAEVALGDLKQAVVQALDRSTR